MAAATTRKKITVCDSRLRQTAAYDYVVIQMDWKKVELCAQNSFTCTHIPNNVVTKMKHVNVESSWMIFSHSLTSRWNDGEEFL